MIKSISQIAILIGFIVCISSCQKECLPKPNDCSQQDQPANQRISDSSNNANPGSGLNKDEQNPRADEIVGGGDDDRDGGGEGGKKGKRVR